MYVVYIFKYILFSSQLKIGDGGDEFQDNNIIFMFNFRYVIPVLEINTKLLKTEYSNK